MSLNVLLLACYELGHQPLSLAWPLAALKEVGVDAVGVDLSLEDFPAETARMAKFVGIAVPMHTALRLGVQAARDVREINPDAHICFYGMYAHLNADYLLQEIGDSVIGGEYETALTALTVATLDGETPESVDGVSTRKQQAAPQIVRQAFPIPLRETLPPLEDYAHYTHKGLHYKAGYTEASRGCLHTCKHCPVVPVYNGRFFVVPEEIVLADIRQQVQAGAQHISFGDPDFLNGPKHALRIAEALHTEFPEVTFDFTAKVEHVIEHQALMPKFAALGCTFIVTAFEAVHEHILERLAKGHTRAQMEEALRILHDAGIAPQPTWMPFTPWTTLDNFVELLDWIKAQALIPYVPIVQLAVRMLVPPGSALLDHADVEEWCGELDEENFSHRWTHPDPRMDQLHKEILTLAEDWHDADPYWVFMQVEQAAYGMSGSFAAFWQIPTDQISVPRLTEHWFC